MLRRLLLAFLALCLALPAALPAGAAMPPAESPVMAEHMHHQPTDSSHHDKGAHAGKHECLGCAAPINRAPAALLAPSPRGPLGRPGLASVLPETRAGPEVPPPRV